MTEKKSLSFPPPMKTFEGRLHRESRPLPSFPRRRESRVTVIPVNRSPEHGEGEREESLRFLPEFTLSKNEGVEMTT
jgi:hypothetical protein